MTIPNRARIDSERVYRPSSLLRPLYSRGQRWRYLAFGALAVAAAFWFWSWWLRPEHFVGWAPFLFATIPLMWLTGMPLYVIFVIMKASRSDAPDPEPGAWRVAMVVTKTPSEPFEVLEKTLTAMLAQDYPHDTWLADEDPSEETRAWCAAHGVRISSRKGIEAYHRAEWPRRTRCKEGNLAYFYDHWGYDNYDIVAQLDADHVPQPGYLREIIRPFADPRVGYVSASSICSANAAESWAARARLHNEVVLHGLQQAGYTRTLAPLCFGSHYAVRTNALREVGGLGPELAEDHSTTLLLNAGGWRGVHAIDAIAIGDGPASIADFATQEFQWSRSLMTLLLQHTGRYLPALPPRLRAFFVFCQLWYPLIAIVWLMLYLTPIIAVVFDLTYADVTYPAFLLHAVPSGVVLTAMVYMMRLDGLTRPINAPVISWEKMLFVTLQWPWVLWGCLVAIRDRITGTFVDFRVTPKGTGGRQRLPMKVVTVYAGLALGMILPVLLSENLTEARGFLFLALLGAMIYTADVVVIVWHHLAGTFRSGAQPLFATITQFGAATAVVLALSLGFVWRGAEGASVLAFGLEPLQLVRTEYGVAGAGFNASDRVKFIWEPRWISAAGM